MLKTTGRAVVVVPDNVLFEGGAGETIRKKLLDNTDLHTILRLPTGVFYAQGVKANVIFFDNHEASPIPWTNQVWYCDYRTNIHHTLKKKPMRFEDLSDFIKCFNPQNRHQRKATFDENDTPEGRWRSYSYEEINIDLVVEINGQHSIPLEVKLTVVPDKATADKDELEWAPEIVIRPVSSAYAMMSVAESLLMPRNGNVKEEVVTILRRAYNLISEWTQKTEICQNAVTITDTLDRTLRVVEKLQRPFLLQPIWKTKGQTLELCDQCFDVFVWSDVSVLRIPVREHQRGSSNTVTRTLREVARHVRSLYDLLNTNDYDYEGIYKGMPLSMQTDKAFALGGRRTIDYLRHRRLAQPVLSRKALDDIILNDGELELKPERRFDVAVQAHMTKPTI